jgi:glycosyltransferase involved in cell wall biosynthesis
MTTLEAMSVGTPVVAADCPSGPAELLGRGRYGILVPNNDAAALAAGMGRLLASPELRAALSQAGLQRVGDFAPPAIVAQWDRIFDQLCDASSRTHLH